MLRDRGRERQQWFTRTVRRLAGCDLVFADPDNGLCDDDRFISTRARSTSHIPLREALALADGRTAVIYHHNGRRKGGHPLEIEEWKERLPGETMA